MIESLQGPLTVASPQAHTNTLDLWRCLRAARSREIWIFWGNTCLAAIPVIGFLDVAQQAIGRDDQAGLFVALAEEAEQVLGAGTIRRSLLPPF